MRFYYSSSDSSSDSSDDEGTPFLDEPKDRRKWSELRELLSFVRASTSKTNNLIDVTCTVTAVLCELLSSGCNLLSPLMLKGVVDVLSENRDARNTWRPYLYVAALVGFWYLSDLSSSLRSYAWEIFTVRKRKDLEAASFYHIHVMNLAYLYSHKMGKIEQWVDHGLFALEDLCHTLFFQVLPMLFQVTIVVTLLWNFKSGGVVAVIIVAVVLDLIVTVLSTAKMVRITKRTVDAYAKASQKERDSLWNFETVKYFGQERREAETLSDLYDSKYSLFMKIHWFDFIVSGLSNIASEGGLLLTLFLSARSVMKGDISVGVFVAVNSYYYQVFNPFSSVGDIFHDVAKDFANVSRFAHFISAKPSIRDRPNAIPIDLDNLPSAESPLIEFENVSLTYKDKKTSKNAVRNISFKVMPGEKIAFVGQSGSGKTCCAKLLLRLFEATQGRVLIGGVDVKDIQLSSLRSQIGIVSQDIVLYNESIRFNITYGNLDATEDQLQEVVRAAALDEFISGLEKGLETQVGSRGVQLSHGQRQRVGIARMLLRKPKLLVLDESTSSLDSITEKKVQESLDSVAFAQGRTTLAIAHRLSTTMHSDHILVLADGEIREKGSHDSLLRRNGVYAEMWNAQTGVIKKADLTENSSP